MKTAQDVAITVAAGFTFFTIDPSENVDQQADNYNEALLREKFNAAMSSAPWFEHYQGKCIDLPSGTTIYFDEQACMRAAVKYGAAIAKANFLAGIIDEANKSLGRSYEVELSVDETDQPTTLAEHYIIADQCIRSGMKLVSLAPRFVGELEKGVDYKGDLTELESSLFDHAAVADMLGPYKLSLHSGSDKLSMYQAFARATKGRFHVKTAGTSYLEALRVVAIHDEALFRRIVRFARARYDTDKATYHVSATNATVPDETDLNGEMLEKVYLERWSDIPRENELASRGFIEPGRQILHCTIGSTLTDAELGPALRAVLESHPDTYREVLDQHFSQHLYALRSGMQ